jgi:hypothetical protein
MTICLAMYPPRCARDMINVTQFRCKTSIPCKAVQPLITVDAVSLQKNPDSRDLCTVIAERISWRV